MSDPFGEPVSEKGQFYATVVTASKKLLQDEASMDLIIKIGNETVNAHACVVSCRCEEIIGFPDEKAKKRKKHEVKLTGVSSASTMHKVLEFLYTGMVEFPKLSDKDVIALGKAARQLKLVRLNYLCERWLIQNLTVEGAFHLLKAVTDAQEERLKGFCVKFALSHYNEFISNKDGIYILGLELFQEVVAAFQQSNQDSFPKETDPATVPDTLLADFKKMYDNMPYADMTVILGSDMIRLHKAVLASHSEPLAAAAFREAETELRISANAFNSMLKFCYYGYDQVDPLPACELVGLCRKYNLLELGEVCEKIVRKSVNKTTVMKILAVSYLPGGKQDLIDDLRSQCIPFILQNLDDINFAAIRTFSPMLIVDLLFEFQSAVGKGALNLSVTPRSARSEGKERRKDKKPAPAPPPRTKSAEPTAPEGAPAVPQTDSRGKVVRRKSSKNLSGVEKEKREKRKKDRKESKE